MDPLFWDKVASAKAMTPEERLLAGFHLGERVRAIMLDGIRHEHPDAQPEELLRILRQRLDLWHALEDRPREP